MQSSYTVLFLVFFLLHHQNLQKKQFMKQLMKRRNTGRKQVMKALAERFIEKECIIYTYNGQLEAVIKEVTDGGLLIKRKDNAEEVVNLDFVIRIREYPRKKNGKKKELILD